MTKAVITVLGADRVGIIAAVSTYLAKTEVNILDISQTIMGDIFTMVMMVDISNANVTFDRIYSDLDALGKELGVKVQIQNTAIFDSMHKI